LINFYSLLISRIKKLPKIDPNIKLEPITKLIGSSIVSLIKDFENLCDELDVTIIERLVVNNRYNFSKLANIAPNFFGESFSKKFLKNFKLEDYVKKNQ